MMSWTAENSFVAGLVLQDGFVGVTFPYYFQHNPSHQQGSNTRRDGTNETPDEDVFRYLATNIIEHNKKYSARNISCYYKAESGVENGYRMSERYRKETLFIILQIEEMFLQEGLQWFVARFQLFVHRHNRAKFRYNQSIRLTPPTFYRLSLGISCCKFPVRFALIREWQNIKVTLFC